MKPASAWGKGVLDSTGKCNTTRNLSAGVSKPKVSAVPDHHGERQKMRSLPDLRGHPASPTGTRVVAPLVAVDRIPVTALSSGVF